LPASSLHLRAMNTTTYAASKGRKVLYWFSDVCHKLASALRPLLLDALPLGLTSDLSFLLSVVQSAISGWLALYIDKLLISKYECIILPTLVLFSDPPSLQSISCWPSKTSAFPLKMQPQLSCLHCFCSLRLDNVTFSPFLTLL
jgi:hypothetical protein